ncbi:MAG: hypothetical protein ACQGVK_10635 [Myxococcota bacterium]
MSRQVARAALGMALAAAVGLAPGLGRAQAESEAKDPTPEAGAPTGGAPAVDLDRLLKLPDSYDAGAVEDKRGGVRESEWRRRFARARADLSEAEEALAKTQFELENAASESGNYQVNAPGVQNPEASPVSFGLRQKLKEQRGLVDERKRALRQLEIEADLAEVPSRWRGGDAATKRSSGSRESGLAPPQGTP